MGELQGKRDGAVNVELRCAAQEMERQAFLINSFKCSFLTDRRARWIVVLRVHLVVRACNLVLLLVGCSRTSGEW